MNSVEYLVGSENVCNLPMRPCAADILNFCRNLAEGLRKDPAAKTWPDIMSLAFWCRKGNLKKIAEVFESEEGRLGRGLTFHIAPANIPVNFAFSYLFSLLAGNANIVRVPSKPFPQTEIICRVLNAVLGRYPEIKKRTAFIRYPADEETTGTFSLQADARMIWGGDETIASLRRLPTKPRCVDVVFADRYSLAVVNGRAVMDASEEELRRLAENFYNDTWLMDQNACSSPQLILWREDSAQARSRFWSAVVAYAASRYHIQAVVSVDKFTQACEDAVKLPDHTRIERFESLLYRVELKDLPASGLETLRGRCGYFYEHSVEKIDEISDLITEKVQTLTYFGEDFNELRSLVIEHELRGIDRIVPIGKAMEIGPIWDGYDILQMLSRIVSGE